MLKLLRQFRPRQTRRSLPASVPFGQRVYAIGDVHGRFDLFQALQSAIERDDTQRDAAETTIILLGDLIDRGPHSADVIAAARAWRKRRAVRLLCGNHEEMFVRSFGSLSLFRDFLQFGGCETVLSYAVDAQAFAAADLEDAHAMMVAAVPRKDIEFLDSFEDYITIGDYLFVHAGIRPGERLKDQVTQDMRWIREPFLSHAAPHEHVVVHGHTNTDEPVIAANRIGIDTGAYMSGRLTALGIEGGARWLIEAEQRGGAVRVSTRPV